MARTRTEFITQLRAEAAVLHKQIVALDDFAGELQMTEAQAAVLKQVRDKHADSLYSTLEMLSMIGAESSSSE